MSLVANINNNIDILDISKSSSHIEDFVEFNGEVFFRATTEFLGTELWKTDGTTAGTMILQDIQSGIGSSQPRLFTEVAEQLFFYADQSVLNATTNEFENRTALWRTDGTETGTQLIKDVNLGADFTPEMLGTINDELYFLVGAGEAEVTHYNLWKTDGTDAGTTLVKEFSPGTVDETFGVNGYFKFKFGDELFFDARDAEHGLELWKTDGTSDGTQLVFNSNPGVASGYPLAPVEMGGNFYFISDVFDPFRGFDISYLYRSNGTASGTERVSDVALDWEEGLTVHDGLIYFTGLTDLDTFFEPHRSDGTAEGTLLLRDIATGSRPSLATRYFVALDQVFFVAADSADDTGVIPNLWTTTGTPESTVKVSNADLDMRRDFVEYDGHLYFGAVTDDFGDELIRSDGTAAGTVVLDLNSGTGSSHPWPKAVFNNELLMIARDDEHGYELWSSDGTAEGSELVADLNAGTGDFTPVFSEFELFALEDQMLFYATNDFLVGNELWSLQTQQEQLDGDFNLDGHVNFVDFLILSANFGKEADEATGDIDGDGQVLFTDFLLFSASFGKSVSP